MTSNVLGQQGLPRFFRVDGVEEPAGAAATAGPAGGAGLAPPVPVRAVAVRTVVRSLAGMQKEAVVTSSAAASGWRLVSDEGPYLNGYDEAPFPLAFLTAGTAASYLTEILALAAQREQEVDGLVLSLQHRYTMEGSAVRGTMVGGALPPEVRVEVTGKDLAGLGSLVSDAIDASPLNGLLRGEHLSRFSLTHNGEPLPVGRVAALDDPVVPDPAVAFEHLEVAGPTDADDLVRRIRTAEEREGVEGGKGSSLQADQRRTLHVGATCRLREDGLKDIEVALHAPLGSTFRFLSDELADGQASRAPDAATLVSAGIAFCFMTQFGRYAAITRKRLDRYAIVQDTHFSAGGASGGTARAGEAEAVDTHVHLQTPEDADFARTLVDMGEQTCFLHALCRTPLKPKVTVGSREHAA
jgi:hypothetical protein